MRSALLLLLLLLTPLLSADEARAGTEGTSRTYLRSWESNDDERHAPLAEFLEFSSALGKGGAFSLNVGGWGRVDLGEETNGDTTRGELQYGHLAWHGATGNRVARLGRLEVTGGVALAERLDGLSFGGDLAGGLSAAAYVGVPVETDDDGRDGDLIYGARIAHRRYGRWDVGASYLKERNDGADLREETGFDIFLRPFRMVTLDGRSAYSIDQSAWMEHHYRVSVVPLPALTLGGEYQDVDYKAFFRAADVTAFLPANLAGEEGMRLAGVEASYAFTVGLTASVSWRDYAYDVAGDAQAAGAGLRYASGSLGAGLSYNRVDGDSPNLRYREYRGYGTWRPGRFDLALDLGSQHYDEAIDGEDVGTTGTVAVGFALRPALRLAADLSYTADPYFSSDVRGMIKLVYGFAAGPKP
ncbi:MAG TPA: hypothetical protein VI078_07520 [bacterium]